MCVESINADPCDNGAQENDIEDVADDSPEEGEHAGKPASDFDNFRADAERGQYWYLPADALWPAKSVNARLPQVALLDQYGQPARYTRGPKNGEVKKMPASVWLDRNSPVQSLTWAPGYPQLIPDRIFKLGGFIEAPGNVVLNRYQPPTINITHANFRRVDVYVEHWHWLYPDDADHCLAWQAQKVQHPEIKINHCLLLGGVPGIGKDLALVPLSEAVGVSNFISLSPKVLLEKWTYFR
jgi:hypothetical protein